jgi:hypothetical protein
MASPKKDRVVIRHFSRDDAAPCGNVVGVRVLSPHSISLSLMTEDDIEGVPPPACRGVCNRKSVRLSEPARALVGVVARQ